MLMPRTIGLLAVVATGCASAPADMSGREKWTPVGLCGGGGLYNPAVSPHDPKMMMVESDMGGRYISRDGGRTWRMIHYRQIGSAVRGAPPLIHPTRPGLIYALSGYQAARIYVSRDAGKTWRPLSNNRQPRAGVITRFFVDPDHPERLFIGTAEGDVLFTDNEGGKWRQAEGIRGRVFRFAADRTDPKGRRVYFVGTPAGVFRSDDGGESFKLKAEGLPSGRRVTGFAGGSDGKRTILYATVSCWLAEGKLAGGVYVSTDGAETWRRCMNPKINVQTQRTSRWAKGDLPQYSHVLTNDANPRRAYVYCGGTSYFPPNHSTIYRTDDAGGSWTDVFFGDPRFERFNLGLDWMMSYMGQSWIGGPSRMEISPVDPDVVMRTDGMFMFFTTDGGRSWLPGHAVKATEATEDADVTWRNNGLVNTTTWHYYVDPHEPSRHYIAYTDIGFARSFDGGLTWRWWGPGKKHTERSGFPLPSGWTNTCYELAFDPDRPGKMWGAFSGHHDIPNENSIWRGTGRSRLKGGLARTEDFGVTWKPLRNGLPEAPTLSVVVDPSSPEGRRVLYAAVYDHGVYKSTDDGESWLRKSRGLGHPDNMRICRLHLHPDGTVFALITGMRVPANGPFTTKGVGLYRSRDGAETWEMVNRGYLLVYPKDFGVDPSDSRVIYVGACDGPRGEPRQGGLHRTTDGGKTWTLVMRRRATHFGAYFHPARPGWIYATSCGWSDAPEGPLWVSTDNGRSWRPFTGLPFANTNRVDFDPTDDSVIYVTTFGGSVWKGPARP